MYFCLTDDGSVRIWRNYLSEGYDGKELVTAFQAISDLIPTVRRKFLYRVNDCIWLVVVDPITGVKANSYNTCNRTLIKNPSGIKTVYN